MTHPSDTPQIEHPAAEFQGADDLDLDDLKSRINPAYANTKGTESYERRLCVERIEQQAKRIEELEGDLHDAAVAPWPQWAEAVLKIVRKRTGYDGYDDADGVDLPEELREMLAEEDAINKRQLANAQAERDEAVAQIALAREALEAVQALIPRACKGGLVFAQEFAPVTAALSTLTTGNAVQAIEARALREAAEFVDRNLYDCHTYADELRKLAEQKEKQG